MRKRNNPIESESYAVAFLRMITRQLAIRRNLNSLRGIVIMNEDLVSFSTDMSKKVKASLCEVNLPPRPDAARMRDQQSCLHIF